MNNPPHLDSDKGRWPTWADVPARCKVERRVVWNLLLHLEQHGFKPIQVNDGGDDPIPTPTKEEAMEAVFAVDDAYLFVRKDGYRSHVIWIVLGNGIDCIADYGFAKGDLDEFDKTMQAFNEEEFE